MTEDWFKWVVGGMFTLGSAVMSWTILYMLQGIKELQKQISNQDRRLAVVEDRPRIDPTQYTEEMSDLRHAVKNLQQNNQQRGPGR